MTEKSVFKTVPTLNANKTSLISTFAGSLVHLRDKALAY